MGIFKRTHEDGKVCYSMSGRMAHDPAWAVELRADDGKYKTFVLSYSAYTGHYYIYDPDQNYQVASISKEFFEQNFAHIKDRGIDLVSDPTC